MPLKYITKVRKKSDICKFLSDYFQNKCKKSYPLTQLPTYDRNVLKSDEVRYLQMQDKLPAYPVTHL
jgi:hypothetical protein